MTRRHFHRWVVGAVALCVLGSPARAQEKPPETDPPPVVTQDPDKEPTYSPPPEELPRPAGPAPLDPGVSVQPAERGASWEDVRAFADTARFAQEVARPAGLSDSLLARFRADPAFDYSREAVPRPSILARFFNWLGRHLSRGMGATRSDETVRWFFIALAVALLAWGGIVLFRAGGGGLFRRRRTKAPVEAVGPLLPEGEDIETVDLGSQLDEAVAARRWRDAIRLQYLLALQRLVVAGHIAWSPDATNREYLRAVRGTPLAGPFAAVTRAFEYAWYGDFPVSESAYGRVVADFARLGDALERVPERQPAEADA